MAYTNVADGTRIFFSTSFPNTTKMSIKEQNSTGPLSQTEL